MDKRSAASVARQLGTSVPRVLRAVDRLGLRTQRSRRARLALTEDDVATLGDELGSTPTITGLRRSQVRVLAALARAPFGLRSGRSASRATGLSPTTAARALRELVDLGLAEVRHEVVAEGTARDADVVHANLADPRWPGLAAQLSGVQLPMEPQRAPAGVPGWLAHVFWNAPVRDIDIREHGVYVARRVLRDGDTQALAWAAGVLDVSAWTEAAQGRGLDPRERALAQNLAASAA